MGGQWEGRGGMDPGDGVITAKGGAGPAARTVESDVCCLLGKGQVGVGLSQPSLRSWNQLRHLKVI
jgi:hypothetical protein